MLSLQKGCRDDAAELTGRNAAEPADDPAEPVLPGDASADAVYPSS